MSGEMTRREQFLYDAMLREPERLWSIVDLQAKLRSRSIHRGSTSHQTILVMMRMLGLKTFSLPLRVVRVSRLGNGSPAIYQLLRTK